MDATKRQLSGLGLILAIATLSACTGVIEKGVGSDATSGPVAPTGSAGAGQTPQACSSTIAPTPAPLRRLTQFEYDNTLRDLANVPHTELPAEDIGNLFSNDVARQSVPPKLVPAYHASAASVAASLTSGANIGKLAACATSPAGADETGCARQVVQSFVPKAYRRPLAQDEIDGLVQLFQTIRGAGQSFQSSIAAMIEAVLQGPDFLYRPEFGVAVDGRADVRRVSDVEMAVRLSYLLWGSMPDQALTDAAAAGELHTPEQIKAAATRLLADGSRRSHDVVRYFFDYLLPIQALSALTRDPDLFPGSGYTSAIGPLMRAEAETLLDKEVFEGSGTWPGILTVDHTYANADLAAYYGLSGVVGTDFQKVPLDGVKRAGLLTLGGIVTGPIHSNMTNPVTRGGTFIYKTLLCKKIAPPANIVIPPLDPDSAPTARQRFAMHEVGYCAGCHAVFDPIGFALENFDAIGRWRDQENGVDIDATGGTAELGSFKGAIELGRKLAESETVQGCFAERWMDFGYGRTTDPSSCALARVQEQFKAAGFNVQQLMVALTQTDDFLYLPVEAQ